MATSLAEDIRILFLEGNIEIEKARKSSYKEQKNIVTALHAEATEAVIKQMQRELNELLAKKVFFPPVSSTGTTGNTNSTPLHVTGVPVFTELGKKTIESVNVDKPTFEEFTEYYKIIIPTSDEADTTWLYNYYEKANWKTKGKPIIDWKKAVRTYLQVNNGRVNVAFEKPTLDEFVEFYLLLKPDTICSDTETDEIKTLYNHYEKLGWKSHGKQMKDWMMSVRQFIRLKKSNTIE